MPCQPGANLWLLMGRVVVENDVDGLIFRQFGLDGVEEADELLMPVALMLRPITEPSRMLRAANKVVVPWRI